jgi:hypothetical protein
VRYKLPILPKGQRHPGAGRAKGTPNAVSVDARQLVSELVTDPLYQRRLRDDFRARKLHPTMESIVWAYHLGKPRQDINIDANVTVNARLDEEKRLFAQLELRDLEQLAAESQGMVDRAAALVAARHGRPNPLHLVVEVEPRELPSKLLRKRRGSDNGSYVHQHQTEGDVARTPNLARG